MVALENSSDPGKLIDAPGDRRGPSSDANAAAASAVKEQSPSAPAAKSTELYRREVIRGHILVRMAKETGEVRMRARRIRDISWEFTDYIPVSRPRTSTTGQIGDGKQPICIVYYLVIGSGLGSCRFRPGYAQKLLGKVGRQGTWVALQGPEYVS
jgi:hypothetical protein